MTADDIKNTILRFTDDVVFYYGDESACIVPLCNNGVDSFKVGWHDKVKLYNNINDLMSDPFFDGKSLKDIADKVEIV